MSPESLSNARQIAFDLGARPAFGRDDFQIGKSNAAAVGWIDRWPEWSAPVLILQGPPASGKSHLVAVWQEKTHAHKINPEWLTSKPADELFALGDALVIDGLDPWLGDKKAETTLFHLYNMLKEEQRTMMITMRMAPSATDFVLLDLASRFRAAPSVAIHSPDDMLLSSILNKLFCDRQLCVGNDIITYLLPRMERSVAAAQKLVSLADHRALSEKKKITIPLLRLVLSEMQSA